MKLRRLTNLVLLKLAQNTLTGCLPVGLSDVADNDLSLLELPECALSTDPDRLVLELFYRATNGPNWEFTATWMTDVPLEDWLGVDTDAQGRVTALELWITRELTGTNSGRTGGPGTAGITEIRGKRIYRDHSRRDRRFAAIIFVAPPR